MLCQFTLICFNTSRNIRKHASTYASSSYASTCLSLSSLVKLFQFCFCLSSSVNQNLLLELYIGFVLLFGRVLIVPGHCFLNQS